MHSTRTELDRIAFFYNEKAKQEKQVYRYLAKRGLDPSRFIDDPKYMLGWAGDTNTTKTLLRNMGVAEADWHDLGIIDGRGSVVFQKRLTFPVLHKGRCRFITSRTLNPSVKPAHKHLSRKMIYMYNTDFLLEHSPDSYDGIYIVEGIIDCLSMIQMGIPETISSYGISGVKSSLRDLLPRISTPIYIVFDNDRNGSGNKGANGAAWALSEWGYTNVFVLTLFKEKDKDKADCNDVLLRSNSRTRKEFWEHIDHMTRYSTTDDYAQKKQRSMKKKIRELKHMYDEVEEKSKDTLEDFDLLDVYEMLMQKSVEWGEHLVCPFTDHREGTGSFVTYRETNTFYCFGCGRGGGVLQFLKHFYHADNYGLARRRFMAEIESRGGI